MRLNQIIVLSVFLLNPVHLIGQGFPVVRTYDTVEFGAHHQNWSFIEDDNGAIFIGNGAGIVRFDGNSWEYKHVPNSNHVLTLFKSKNGTIYYGSEGEFGFLKSNKHGEFLPVSLTNYIDQKEFITGDVWSIHEINGAIFFQTSFGFYVWENDLLRALEVGFNVRKSFLVNDQLYIKEEGGGLHILIESQSISIKGPNEFLEDQYSFLIPYEGRVLYGGDKSGLFLYDGNEFKKFSINEEDLLKKSTIYNATWINNNEFAIASLDSGLFVLDRNGEKVHHISEFYFSESRLISNNWILGLYLSSENQLWVATLYGVAVLDIASGIRRMGLPSTNIHGISIGFEKNEVYIGGYQGLFTLKLDGTDLDFHQLSSKVVTDVEIIEERIYVSTDEGLEIFSNDKKEVFNNAVSFYGSEIVDRNGQSSIYFITNQGLYIGEFDTNNFRLRKSSFAISASEIIYWDQKLWLKNEEAGLISINIDSLNSFELIDINGVLPRQIHQLGIINDRLNISTQTGLYVFDEESKKLVKNFEFKNSEIENKQVYRFYQLNSDSIWFINDKRLKLAYKENEIWEMKDHEYRLLPSTLNGIDTDNDGRLWAITNVGIFNLQDTEWEYRTDFTSRVTSISVNSDSLIYGGFGKLEDKIILPYSENELRFTFSSSFIAPQNNTYSVMLEGFDADWSNWSSENYKDYTNIPEGDYTFKVRSKNIYEVEGKPNQIAFTVLPPWYRTWWAYMLYFISFSGFLYSGYKVRVNQLLKVERMRTKIASDLHDEVSATLTGISYFAEAIKRDENQSKAAHFVSLISESAGDAKEKITDIVWSINPDNDSWELFLSKCRRFASDLLESKELEYKLNITEHVPGKLSMEIRQHLWMIFKEMVTNAVRHSKATRLDVIMDIENGMLKLIVQDNGIGFDLDEIREGNGVRNIRKRAAKIGAIINVHSEEDFGTRWRMELPL